MMRVPEEISPEVRDFCRELEPTQEPRFVELRPTSCAAVNNCFVNVSQHAAKAGGRVVYGWDITEVPGAFYEAQFHAVWESPARTLINVTPNQLGAPRILFLADSKRVYKGRLVPSRQKALTRSSAVREFLAVCQHRWVFEADHYQDTGGETGEMVFSPEEEEQYKTILERCLAARKEVDAFLAFSLPSWAGAPSRNRPCPCGSGEKFKRCHGDSGNSTP